MNRCNDISFLTPLEKAQFTMKSHKEAHNIPRADGIDPALLAKVREEMHDAGITQAGWAKANGFTRNQVVDVLTGRRLCLRGKCHEIAVALGLKKGRIVKASQFRPAHVHHQGAAS
jgi:gp16 family phage-associated protein